MSTQQRQGRRRHVVSVILLKTKSQPHDNYEEYFQSLHINPDTGIDNGLESKSEPDSISFNPIFTPVLEHQRNEEALDNLGELLHGGKFKDRYGGMIFTSQRAVEGWNDTVLKVEGMSNNNNHDGGAQHSTDQNGVGNNSERDVAIDTRTNQPFNTDISSTTEFPVYVVGPATSRALGTLVTSLESYQTQNITESSSSISSSTTYKAKSKIRSKFLQLNPKIQGEHTGNGANLAIYIQNHYNALQRDKYFTYYEAPRLPFIPLVGMGSENYSRKRLESSDSRLSKKPLLFLVGEQRRDIIPKTLMLVGDQCRDQIEEKGRDKDVLSQHESVTKPEVESKRNEKYIAVEEVEVYSTCVRKDFKREFNDLIARKFSTSATNTDIDINIEAREKQDLSPTSTSTSTPSPASTSVATPTAKTVIIIIFSPQGTKEMLKSINFINGNDQPIKENIQDNQSRWNINTATDTSTATSTSTNTTSTTPASAPAPNFNPKDQHHNQTQEYKYIITTIGPTTKSYLETKFGIEPDICAENPSPQGLGGGIIKFFREQQDGKNEREEKDENELS